MEKHHLRMVVSLLFVSCLTACGGGGGSSLPAVGSATNPILSVAGAPSTKKPLTSPAAVTLLDIDCGSTVPVGPWSADADYTMTGAQGTHVVTSAINTAAVSNPPPPAVYQTQRYATHLTYKIPNLVANATYTVRLDFVESFYLAAGQRVFGVAINGTQALTNFDIFATAGGSNIAVAKQFTVAADATGAITIAMNATVNNATISGIEITAGSAATPTPVPTATASPSAVISIDSGSSTADGSFVADTDYSAPGWSSTTVVTNAINTSLIANPAPQAVYQSQRYGPAFTYTIPKLTPNGTYAVRLHFVESFFTSAGSRVFNILVNGNTVYSGLDLFKEAGGANIAIVKQFAVVANSAGTITVTLNATVNNAAIAGLEVFPGNGSLASPTPQPSTTPTPKPSPSPSPTPSASPTPIASGDTLPWVWTQLWSAASPMRLTVATQKALGAAVVPHTYMDSLWNQGTAFNTTAQQIPIYVARSSDPVLTVTCTDYGGGCDASGVHVHVPSYAQPQGGQLSGPTSDRHMTVIDEYSSSGPIEVDCWQTQLPGNGVLSCSWAGLFALGGLGTDNGGEGVHFGRPVSTYFLSGQEIANGHIDHPLGINAVCLNSPNLYPAQTFTGTDTACNGGGSNPPHYGNLIHLLWSPTQIAASAYSQPCKVVLTALATYGAYLDDTGDTGNQMRVENELTYTANPATASLDPWPQIQSQMNAAGDGSGSSWSSCLNRLTSGDFEMLQDAPA